MLAFHHQPQFPQALYNRALVALRRAELDEALACLEQAIALMPDYAAAHNNPGYVLCCERARFAYQVAIGSLPWYPLLRFFRRQRANGWVSVVAAVSVELAELRRT